MAPHRPVLDTLDRIEPTTQRVGLASAEATGTFDIVGLDAHGTSAPVEPRDVTLDYDHVLFGICDDSKGNFTVTSRTGGGAGQIRATVAGATTVLAVGPADEGGFTGWSLVGADHVSPGEQAAAREKSWKGAPDWVSVQTRAHVDTLTPDAPSVLGAGHTAKITASVTQGARSVPVAFPPAADWTGSPNVHIGHRDSARHRYTVVFDPSTGTLTALRPGTITLAVTVNGTTQLTRIRIASEGTASAARRNTRTTRRSRTRFHVPAAGPVLPLPYCLR